VVVAEDCVASDDLEQHEASLVLMRHRFDMVDSQDVIAWWQERVDAAIPEGAMAGERV
jgi:hypothetical protein